MQFAVAGALATLCLLVNSCGVAKTASSPHKKQQSSAESLR